MLRASNYILIALMLVACRKDPQENNPDTGIVYPPPPEYVETTGFPDCSLDLEGKYVVYEDDPSSANYYVTHSDTTLRGFRISSLDENRLLMVVQFKVTPSTQYERMVIYNTATGTIETVGTFNPYDTGIPDWNKEERVIFTGADYQLYTVNSDGSDLRQLSTSFGNSSPIWSPDGTKICFHQYNAQGQHPDNRYDIVCDANGKHLDTLSSKWTLLSQWEAEDILLMGGAMLYYDIRNKKEFGMSGSDPISWSMTMSLPGEIVYVSWIYTTNGSIWAYNLGTKTLRPVKPACRSNRFTCIDYAPKQKKLFVSSARLIPTGGNTLREVHDLYRMDINGDNPELIHTFH